jgi:hypothetical protein
MDVLLIVGLSAGLFLALELRTARRPDPEADGTAVEGGLFSPEFVRRRLAALAEELDRLDHDPDVFAKAFHAKAARAAYEALVADASRLTDRPRPQVGAVLDDVVVGTAGGVREVLEL